MKSSWLSRISYFNPLPPHGGRQCTFSSMPSSSTFQSTPSAWRETTIPMFFFVPETISIHSLRMEGDQPSSRLSPGFRDFNPLPPHGGRPLLVHINGVLFVISIHSLRMEGDCRHRYLKALQIHFNPLPPHGGRPSANCFFSSMS